MKLYLHYEVDGDDKTTTKLTVPKSWYSKAVISIIGLFCESYNKKHVDAPLSADHIHLADNDGTQIYSDSIINEVLQEVLIHLLLFYVIQTLSHNYILYSMVIISLNMVFI
jgi:hypothetical protein